MILQHDAANRDVVYLPVVAADCFPDRSHDQKPAHLLLASRYTLPPCTGTSSDGVIYATQSAERWHLPSMKRSNSFSP